METTSTEEVSATESSRMVAGELSPAGESAASSKRKGNPAKAKPAGAKAGKTAREQRQSARTAAKGEKLVCRYCAATIFRLRSKTPRCQMPRLFPETLLGGTRQED